MRICCSSVLFFFLVLLPAPPVSARSSASIIAFDQLVQPDRSVRLAVRLVTGGLSFVRHPISGERIEFILEGRSLGQTLTGGDGMAVKPFMPSKPGLYLIAVRLVENPRYEADAVELNVACRNASHPILPVTLSSVRSPSRPPAVPFSPAPSSEAMPEAARILVKLSERYQLVYLETGDEALGSEVKDWLARQEFPPAPLFVWPLPGESDAQAERFAERFQSLRDEGWKNIPAGITRSAGEAEGLIKMKVKAIVLVEEDDDIKLPETARKVTDWKAVPKNLN
jgi:hypothetical protein